MMHRLIRTERVRRALCTAFGAAIVSSALFGCSNQSDALKERFDKIEERLRDVERQNGRASVRLEDLEDRVNIIGDRVETSRLALERRGIAKPLPMIVARPDESGGVVTNRPKVGDRKSRVSLAPSRSSSDAGVKARFKMPRTFEERALDPHAPVVQEPARGGSDGIEEVVITEDQYREFVKTDGVNRDDSYNAPTQRRPARRAAGISRARQAKDPVTDETLPVVPIDGGGNKGVSQHRSAMDIYKSGLALYRAGDYDAALQEFTAYLQKGPSRGYLDNAYYWLGECSFGLGRYQDAIGYFNRVIRDIPEGNKVPDSMLKASLAYVKIGQKTQAKSILYNLLETYPSTNAAKLATQKLNKLD